MNDDIVMEMERYSKSVWCIEKRNVYFSAFELRQKIDSVKWNCTR